MHMHFNLHARIAIPTWFFVSVCVCEIMNSALFYFSTGKASYTFIEMVANINIATAQHNTQSQYLEQ